MQEIKRQRRTKAVALLVEGVGRNYAVLMSIIIAMVALLVEGVGRNF